MDGNITPVIATRNDPLLGQTLRSIMQGFSGRIIVIDDCSDKPLDQVDPHSNIVIWRNQHRLGPGPSRHLGASHVFEGWLMFCDSHMEFPANWYEIASDMLASSDVCEIWGAVYRQNFIDNSFWHDTHLIGGADFYWWRHHDLRFTFIDLLPRRILNRVEYDVPVLLGGCYFIHTEWFRKVGGFSTMMGYGSEEPWMAWNTHLLGGRVKIMGNLTATHIWTRGTGMRKPMIPEWEINRLMIAKRVLNHDEYDEFCSWLPVSPTIKQQVEMIADSSPKLFTREFDVLSHAEVEQAYRLQTFDEVIWLMKDYHDRIETMCPMCKNRQWMINGRSLVPCQRCNAKGVIAPKVNYFTLEPTFP